MPDLDLSRQSFLGPALETAVENARLAIVGLSGGGSHLVQQFAHIGFRHFRVFDPDFIELSNLTRLVGATVADVHAKRLKVDIAARVIRGISPDADVKAFPAQWQDHANALRQCDLVFGCVDSFLARRDLELFCRRYRLALIDLGMDVIGDRRQGFRMFGQAALSMPGGPCLFCQRLLTESALAQEGTRYGAAGGRPQVVWANGVLAATAVGIAMDVLTAWSGRALVPFASFDGNTGLVSEDVRLGFVPLVCPHFAMDDVGDPRPLAIS